MLHAERLTCIVDDRPLFAALTLSSLPASCCRSPVITVRENLAAADPLRPGAPGKRGGELAGPAAGEGPGVISPSAAVAGP